MIGKLRNLLADKRFGFISCEGADYFFHKDDYRNDWDELVLDYHRRKIIELDFDTVPGPKGPRANNVRRITE